MHFKRKKRISTPPDITPMIDVVFLLLIFFMLSTTFIIHPGITITLPKSSAEEIKKEKEEIEVTISENGMIYIKEKEVTDEELKSIFAEAASSSMESVVIINADEKAKHGRVVLVMDSAKESGITKLAVATNPKK
jgi:biopolymer transport protein ExbD